MASHESNEDSVKTPAADKMDTTAQSEADEKSSIVSSVDQQQSETNDAINTENEKSLTLDTPNECTDVQEKDTDVKKDVKKDDVKSEGKHDPNSSVTGKVRLDKSEADVKPEAQDVTLNKDSENTDEKNIKNEDNKDSLAKVGSALKRKRKPLRLV